MSGQISQARRCQNYLLSKLSDEDFQELLPTLHLVESKAREELYHQGEPIEYVHFPCDCAHSCLIYMEDGSAVEVGTLGNESFTGIELLLNATHAVETVICQVVGHSLRMSVADSRRALEKHPAFRRLLQCSAQGYLAQVSQSVACNRLHSVDMRFARWLLVTHDRVKGNEFNLTQEFLAAMLGVHRPSVSLVAGAFQQAGIIRYSRGKMQILDRDRLEEASCECYAMVRDQYVRLLGIPHG
ncbi:Crp/Fnr family transcriptional regulator [Oxalobacteraceae bacterium R-40]|uniref:Crp/Fnr family transcriptional regulator n=1 Tax=Keguizhuia sedimenti TaxID=3064264 RepID=A0ABU1BKT1_9BURK|nr:Crp/Fnr family transcriptional regulator [Oxalobacteraceae bacterium R-40]